MSTQNFYDMSDEEFLRSSPPPVDREADAAAAKEAAERAAAEEVANPSIPAAVVEPVANQELPGNTPAQVSEQVPDAVVQPVVEDPAQVQPVQPVAEVQEGEQTPTDSADTPAAVEPPNYEELYQQVMAPFKANGKTIELKDADEVRQLLQMGANYTKNMQQIAPQRKTLLALQNAGINAEQLNFLIDLHQKKPEAIARLVSDAGIEPVSIDTSTAADYRAGDHSVTDQQVAFKTALDDVVSSEGGQATLDAVNQWDEASKNAAFADPKILSDFHAHRSNGIYEKVSSQLERARMLGQIPANVPYVNAYGHVFQEMLKGGAFEEPKPAPTPVAVRVAAPKPVVANSQAASAAAPSTSSGTKVAEQQPNWLSMNDDEFMKNFEKFKHRL